MAKGYSFDGLAKLAEATKVTADGALQRTGGTIKGQLNFDATDDTGASMPRIRAFADDGANNYGQTLGLISNGAVAVTAGETVSAEVEAELTGASSETVVLAADSSLRFISNGNTWDSRHEMAFRNDGMLEIPNKIIHKALATTNKQILNANSSGVVFVGNPEVASVNLETVDGKAYVKAGTGSNHRIYTEGFRPTPAAIGAVNKAGDSMTGNLQLLGDGLQFAIKNAADTHGMRMVMSGERGYYQAGTINDPEGTGSHQLSLSGFMGKGLSDFRVYMQEGVSPIVDWPSGDKKVYHEGFKPTPSGIGAASSKEFYSANSSGGITYTRIGKWADGGTGGNGGAVIIAAGESMPNAIANINHDNEEVSLVADAAVQIYTNGQNGWSEVKKATFNNGELYLVDGSKKVYHQGFKPTPAEVGAVNKAGDTMTGNLTTPKVLVSATQGTEANALTRKDYVNSEDAKKLSLAGGTMTGKLQVDLNGEAIRLIADASNASYILSYVNGANNWYVGKGSTGNDDVVLNSYIHANSLVLKSDHIYLQKDPRSGAAQGSNAASLTRKDYVNAEDAKKLNLTGGTMTGAIDMGGGVLKTAGGSGVRLAGDSYSFLDSPTETHVVQNAFYDGTWKKYDPAKESVMISATGGKLWRHYSPAGQANPMYLKHQIFDEGYKQNKTVGTPVELSGTDDLNAMTSPGVWSQSANVDTSTSRGYPEAQAGALVIYQGAGCTQVYYVYNTSRVWTRSKYSTSAWTAWSRAYDTINKPRAAEGNSDIVASSYGQVGTYGFLAQWTSDGDGTQSPGTTCPGSQLTWTCADGSKNVNVTSGTWKLLGAADNGGDNTDNISLWIRIA